MASAVDSRLTYARLSAVAMASRLPTANRGSNNSYTTSWDTTQHGAGLGTKRHDRPASLGVGQLDAVALHVLPAQKLDLRQPAALRSSKRMAATADGISPSASRRTSPRRSVSSGDRNRSRFRSL